MGSQAKLEPSLVQSESVLYGVQYNGTKIPVLAVGVSILSDMFTLLVFPGPPDPIVPVTVKVYVPGVAVEPTFTVSVDVAESPGLGPGVTELGEKEVVTPLGTLEEDRVTGKVIPPSASVTVIVGLLELPCMIVSELGDEDMLNGGTCPNAFSPDMLNGTSTNNKIIVVARSVLELCFVIRLHINFIDKYMLQDFYRRFLDKNSIIIFQL